MKHQDNLQYLWQRYLSGGATPQEVQELFDYVEQALSDGENEVIIEHFFSSQLQKSTADPEQAASVLRAVAERDHVLKTKLAALNLQKQRYDDQSSKSVFRLTAKWIWPAAAMLICAIGLSLYYFNQQSHLQQSQQIADHSKVVKPDIPPGTNKAILTLANGVQKELGVEDNGQQLQLGAVLLSTPKGGQYQAVLPDGTKIWMNAASSIRFPSTFTHNERKVEVTGEVYFEVAKDASKPFKVVGSGQEIEVLGTAFNVNLYNDESKKQTTLLSGSIKITADKETVMMLPGQQANIASDSSMKITLQTADTDKVLAWKNGFFSFGGVDIMEMMKPIARWYNIEVRYEGVVQPREFKGSLSRELHLSQVLKILDEMQINYKMEGRTLTIKGNK